MVTSGDRQAFDALAAVFRALLPEEYRDTFDTREPAPMKPAGLRFDARGQVAWNEIWRGFCDLALAGGPPHKGALLEPAAHADIASDPDRHGAVAAEIGRGIWMTTGLSAAESPSAGWVRVECLSRGMAGWLVRAITMENVAVRADGTTIDLPASARFRLEKEIKNVVTVVAKTCHYWEGHVSLSEQRAIAQLLAELDAASPLVAPGTADVDGSREDLERARAELAQALCGRARLAPSPHRYAGWLGLTAPDSRAARWMACRLIASNILARAEDGVLFVPVNPAADPGGEAVATSVERVAAFQRG